MKPEGTLSHSQVPTTCPYPEPARSSPYPHILLPEDPPKYYPPIYAWVSQVFSFLQVSLQNPVYASPLPHMRHMPHPSHSSRFYHPDNIVWGVLIIQLLIMRCYYIAKKKSVHNNSEDWSIKVVFQ